MNVIQELNQVESQIAMLEDRHGDTPPLHIQATLQDLNNKADSLMAANIEARKAMREAAEARAEAERVKQLELSFENRMSSYHGGFTAWWEWATSLYLISDKDDGMYVTSKAKDWKSNPTWGPYKSKIDCILKVEVLIGYKIADRKAGHGNVDKDLAQA